MEEETDPISVHDELAEDYLEKFSEPSSFLGKFVEKLEEGDMVLDAGCGPGVDSKFLSSEGLNVTAVDLSEEMLRVGRETFPEIRFTKADLREMDFTKGKFDGIVASFSLIYIKKEDVREVIEDFSNFLRDNGKLFLGLQEGKSQETFVEDPAADGKVFMNVMSEGEIFELLQEKGSK
jgi:ubiquinone/menaquinone biosynthesis C-methylase UbiE